MSTDRSVHALRGATSVDRDDAGAIEAATEALLVAMMERNGVVAEDLISLIFTATPDLTATFPAAAARGLGLADVPLLCAQEIPVRGALPRCVRVLMHLYSSRDYASLRHVYLGEARRLRDDLLD